MCVYIIRCRFRFLFAWFLCVWPGKFWCIGISGTCELNAYILCFKLSVPYPTIYIHTCEITYLSYGRNLCKFQNRFDSCGVRCYWILISICRKMYFSFQLIRLTWMDDAITLKIKQTSKHHYCHIDQSNLPEWFPMRGKWNSLMAWSERKARNNTKSWDSLNKTKGGQSRPGKFWCIGISGTCELNAFILCFKLSVPYPTIYIHTCKITYWTKALGTISCNSRYSAGDSLRLGDVIWHGSGAWSILVQVMACWYQNNNQISQLLRWKSRNKHGWRIAP